MKQTNTFGLAARVILLTFQLLEMFFTLCRERNKSRRRSYVTVLVSIRCAFDITFMPCNILKCSLDLELEEKSHFHVQSVHVYTTDCTARTPASPSIRLLDPISWLVLFASTVSSVEEVLLHSNV